MARKLPETVTLRAVEYRVVEREGSVVFTEAWPVWGQGSRLRFQREVDGGGWYLSLHGDSDRVYVPHAVDAYRLVVEAYGDGFGSHVV